MNTTKTKARITAIFEKMVSADRKIYNAHFLIHSDTNQLHLNLAGGNAKTNPNDFAQVEQPVYMASVGKMFTAVLVAMLCDQGMLSFEQPIVEILDKELLYKLHIYKDRDYTDQIQLKHLLNHTSGLPDYFEDKPMNGLSMFQKILTEPDRTYLPREVVTWSKANLKSKFPPGKGFHYSDTGYHLLGIVTEAVTGMPFQDGLSRWIFNPLGMEQAFLIGHSTPLKASPYPVAGVYFRDTNIVSYRSISADYAGGGVTAPLEDLLIFMQALVKGKLLSDQIFLMMDDTVSFAPGIDYGYGIMKIRPAPLLMPAKYFCWGNAGSTGSFLFYHPVLDTYLIGTLNQYRYHQRGIQFMFRVIDAIATKGE